MTSLMISARPRAWLRRLPQWLAMVSTVIATLGTVPAAGPHETVTAPVQREYGVNVEPGFRPWLWPGGLNPDSWWDPTSGQARADAEIALAARLGVTTVRLEFPWSALEPREQGGYDWNRADYIINRADREGVAIQPVIVFSPAWVGAPNRVPAGSQFGSFVAALVGRYRTSVHRWEMWNEPDLSRYFPR